MRQMTSPCSGVPAAAGSSYLVGDMVRTIPPSLTFQGQPPTVLKPEVLGRQRRFVQHALRQLDALNIRHWLTCGSLIGAMRHHGFIPWDDDTDVQVPVEHEAAIRDMTPHSHGIAVRRSGGGFKLCDPASPWGYPFIDIIFVAKRSPGSTKLELAYPRDPASGALTFAKATQWPREAVEEQDLWPLRRVPFEDFEAWVPAQAEKLIAAMYGSDVMTSAPPRPHPLKNHKSLMVLATLGFVPTRVL